MASAFIQQISQHIQRTSISDLIADVRGVIVVGLIIKKKTPRSFQDKRDPSRTREVFSFIIRDETASTQVVCWDTAVHQFFPEVEMGMKVMIDGATVRQSTVVNKLCTSHLELHVDSDRVRIVEYLGNDFTENGKTPLTPEHIPLSELSNFSGESVNVLAMVEKVNAEEVVTKRNGTGTAVVQRVVIMDQHASGVEVTFWEDLPTLMQFVEEQTIVFLQNVKVSTFGQRVKLSYSWNSMCIVNPEMPEAYVLFHHFEKSVKPPQIESFAASKRRKVEDITEYYSISAISNVSLNPSDEVYGYTVACISKVILADDCVFRGCSKCFRKVDLNDICCEHCQSPTIPRLKVPIHLMDHTGVLERKVVLWSAQAEEVLQCKAEQFEAMNSEERNARVASILWGRYKVYFKLSVDQGRFPKVTVIRVQAVDYTADHF